MYKNFFIALQYLLPQRWLTILAAKVMNWSRPVWLKRFLIEWFIHHYKVDMSSAVHSHIDLYFNFNNFFIRALKQGARPLAEAKIISPVDGAISQIGSIKEGTLIQAKGISYTVEDLLTLESQRVNYFNKGLFATLYLAPKDYHRVHMPIKGKLLQTIYVPGDLFSVNQMTAENVVNLFARNERLVCEFETELGKIAMIFVGAMFVAGIHTQWAGDIKRGKKICVTDYCDQNIVLEQGDEAGYFKFGSTVILLLPESSTSWDIKLKAGNSIMMGQKLL
jgi:phosphatidylserine decarboxylase